MEKIVRRALLFDFYGELLTEHQKNIYSDYVLNDLSYTEIGANEGISRQAVMDEIEFTPFDDYSDYLMIREKIEALPLVNPQPKTGHWNCGDDMFEYAICSSCKHETGEAWEYAKRNFKYCPNCGAKIKSEE